MFRKIVFFALLLVVSACQDKEMPSDTPKSFKPIDVKITPVAQSSIKDEYTLPGIIEPWEVVSVSTEITGHVKTIFKKEGEHVKAGDAIVKIDTSNIDADLQSTKIQYEFAKNEYNRAEALSRQGAATPKALEEAENRLMLTEVDYKLAQDTYNKSFVTSSIEGVVDEIMPEGGEFLATGQPVARIVQADKLKIYLSIPEKDVQYLKLDQDVSIYPNDNESINIVQAKLGYISTISNPQTLTYKARVDTVPGADIYPGKIVRVKLLRKEYTNAIIVPLYSVVDVDGKKIVYLENNGVAVRTEVQIDTMIGSSAVIGAGLKSGDRLITTGQQFLSDSLPVRVVE